MSSGKVIKFSGRKQLKSQSNVISLSETKEKKQEKDRIDFVNEGDFLRSAKSARKLIPSVLTLGGGGRIVTVALSSGRLSLVSPAMSCFFGMISEQLRPPTDLENVQKTRLIRGFYMFKVWAESQMSGRLVCSPFVEHEDGEVVVDSDILVLLTALENDIFPDFDDEDGAIFWASRELV